MLDSLLRHVTSRHAAASQTSFACPRCAKDAAPREPKSIHHIPRRTPQWNAGKHGTVSACVDLLRNGAQEVWHACAIGVMHCGANDLRCNWEASQRHGGRAVFAWLCAPPQTISVAIWRSSSCCCLDGGESTVGHGRGKPGRCLRCHHAHG